MSLEAQIERLSGLIEILNEKLDGKVAAPAATEPEPVPTKAKPAKKKKTAKKAESKETLDLDEEEKPAAISIDDVRNMLRQLDRDDAVAIMFEHGGAKVLSGVPANKYGDIVEAIIEIAGSE